MRTHGLVAALALVALAVAPGVRGAAHSQCVQGTSMTDLKLGALRALCNNRDRCQDRQSDVRAGIRSLELWEVQTLEPRQGSSGQSQV
jgi:hypothetical protein